MKKFIKNNILGFIIGVVFMGTITVVYAINANHIGYEPEDTTWEVSTTAEALNSLYTSLENLPGAAELVTYQGNVASGTEINVGIGNYIIISSVAGSTATNAERIGGVSGGYWNKVNGYMGVYRATATNVVIGTDSGNTLSYVVIK